MFEIASTLTTASASSVVLINGAIPCNVYWQVGSSATLGTTTAFQGNVMALASISLNNGATVIGRLLARNGAVTPDQQRARQLAAAPAARRAAVTTPGRRHRSGGTGRHDAAARPRRRSRRRCCSPPRPRRPATRGPTSIRNGTTVLRRTPHQTCTSGFRASVTGKKIKRVVFTLDGKRIHSQTNGPYTVFVRALPGAHAVRAHVTFTDATKPKTLALGYRACAEAVLQPHSGPSLFTG